MRGILLEGVGVGDVGDGSRKRFFRAMTKLSVNINKIAVLRNSRGGNLPDVVRSALAIERFGAEGITVHPRPDARHIRYQDVRDLKAAISTELNIEGNPIPSFVDLVLEVVPAQVTLVPDAADAITSNAGWDTVRNRGFLTDICGRFNEAGIRTSIFVDPVSRDGRRAPRRAERRPRGAICRPTPQAYARRLRRRSRAGCHRAHTPPPPRTARRCGSGAQRRPRPRSGESAPTFAERIPS